MLGRPKNRRKPAEARRRLRLPAINWRYAGIVAGVLAVIACGAGGVMWAMNQPIETVAVQGRFQRVTPADVERVVKSACTARGSCRWTWPRCGARSTRCRGWTR